MISRPENGLLRQFNYGSMRTGNLIAQTAARTFVEGQYRTQDTGHRPNAARANAKEPQQSPIGPSPATSDARASKAVGKPRRIDRTNAIHANARPMPL